MAIAPLPAEPLLTKRGVRHALRSTRSTRPAFLAAFLVLGSACANTVKLGEPVPTHRPLWGPIVACRSAAPPTSSPAEVLCYERVDGADPCMRTEDRWLVPALRAQENAAPACARGPFRATAESPHAEKLCCYSLQPKAGP